MLVLSDDFADQDLIGHEVYRDGLVEVIRSVEAQGSFTIGIYGQWGLGKTSIMKQIKAIFDDKRTIDDKPILTVWFNPWQFVAEEHLIIPFFHTLNASLEKIAVESTTGIIGRKLPGFLEKIAKVTLALTYGIEGELKIPFLMNTSFSPSKTIEYLEKKDGLFDEKNSQLDKMALQTTAKNYESIYYNLIQILQDEATEMDFKIVVFIDDLDRCLPEKAVQLLEGLKVLLDLPNFIFVIGVDQEIIERGIRVRYKELYLTEGENDFPNIEVQYLDKIVQFPFSLPAANPDELKQNILTKHLEKLEGTEKFVDLIYEVLGSNPRTLKRFINAVSFSIHLAEKKMGRDGAFHPELLIKISLIGYLFPALYRQLEINPIHLVRLEEIINEIEEEREKKKEEENKGITKSQDHQSKKTGLPNIDQWLEDEKIKKLLPILKIREVGFLNKETVSKYLHLMASSLQSEVVSKAKDTPIRNLTISEYIQDRMVEIPAGNFTMGDSKFGCKKVIISRPFLMDKYPVTQDLYQVVMNKNPSHFIEKDRPVENITWFDAIEFCNELSKNLGLQEAYEVNGTFVERKRDSNGYRLPTEAEWEFACRANTKGERYGELDEIAWYDKNSDDQTQVVGQKKANKYGLYDMLGNVWEWCEDWYADYSEIPESDPNSPETGLSRIMRGGSWVNYAITIKSSHRGGDDPRTHDYNVGFRIVLPLFDN